MLRGIVEALNAQVSPHLDPVQNLNLTPCIMGGGGACVHSEPAWYTAQHSRNWLGILPDAI